MMVQLAHAEAIMQRRLRAEAMANGVTLKAPETIFLSADTNFGTDIIIEAHVVIGKGHPLLTIVLSGLFLTSKGPVSAKTVLWDRMSLAPRHQFRAKR